MKKVINRLHAKNMYLYNVSKYVYIFLTIVSVLLILYHIHLFIIINLDFKWLSISSNKPVCTRMCTTGRLGPTGLAVCPEPFEIIFKEKWSELENCWLSYYVCDALLEYLCSVNPITNRD